MKSSYDPNTLIAAASWVSSGTCTAGRVTAAIASSAGLRRVDCALEEHPSSTEDASEGLEGGGEGLDAGIRGALGALQGFGSGGKE